MNPDIAEFDEIFTRDFDPSIKPSYDELLEKLTILTHIFDREFHMYLLHG